MAYILPQVLVFQEFDLVPAAGPNALLAHISGAHAFLLRYAVPDEKILGFLGAYDPLNDVVSEWPQRPPGGIVDDTYTKVYIDSAMLQYFSDMIGTGDVVAPVGSTKISISGTYGFMANGVNFPRFPALGDRDVQPGDRVYIRGVGSDSKNYELNTYVTAIEADPIGAVIDAATMDPANGATVAATTGPVSQTAGTINTVKLATDFSNYSALADGAIIDTYTIEVVQSSVGQDFTTAQLRITTSSGNDDDLVVTPAIAGTPFYVGNRGLRLVFTSTAADDLIVGMTFEAILTEKYTAIHADSTGSTYRGSQSTTYVIEITRGGTISTDVTTCPQFRAITVHGTDSSQALPITAVSTAFPVGTQGVQVTFGPAGLTGIRKGDRFYITVVAARDGRMSTIVLANNLPPLLLTPTPTTDLDLILYVERNVMVDELSETGSPNWEQNETQIIIHSGIVAYDEAFTAGGEPQPLTITSGSIYVEYRAWLADLANQVGTISDVGTIDELIPGPLTPDNPLKWGVFYALTNSNGSEVKFTAVANPDDPNSWISVLSLLVGRTDVYNLVPLTFDRTILDLYAAHVNDESAPEQACWRAMFCSIQAKSQIAVVSAASSANGGVVMATIADDPNAVGNQYTLLTVPAGNGNFLTNKVQPGDIVRTDYGIDNIGAEIYDEYVVDQILNEDSILLMAGPVAAVTVAQKIEVWHYLNKDEVASDLARQAGSFGSRRVKAVWPDTVGAGGVLMEGFYICAALAGLRSGVVPQQGLTNVQVMGFDDLSRTTDFFGGAQLNVMAGAGTWIVTQSPAGTVYNRHAVTTDPTDVNSSEEMVTSNLDSISYLFSQRLAPYIGMMNVTPSAIQVLGTEIDATIDFLKSNGYVARLGGQLIDATVISLQPHAILADRVVCVIDVTLPYPLNNLEIHLVV
jgi:hypothetical protein